MPSCFGSPPGAIFGPDQPVSLQLLEITPALPVFERNHDGA